MTTKTIFFACSLCVLACFAAGGAACAGEQQTMSSEMYGIVGDTERYSGREQQTTQGMYEFTAEMAEQERAAAEAAEAARRAAVVSSSSGSSAGETINTVLDVIDVATLFTGGGVRAAARRALTGGARAAVRHTVTRETGHAARGGARHTARREATSLALEAAQFAGSGTTARPSELSSTTGMYGSAAEDRESYGRREQQTVTDEMFGYPGTAE